MPTPTATCALALVAVVATPTAIRAASRTRRKLFIVKPPRAALVWVRRLASAYSAPPVALRFRLTSIGTTIGQISCGKNLQIGKVIMGVQFRQESQISAAAQKSASPKALQE